MGDFNADVGAATEVFASELVELIKAQVIEETARALEVDLLADEGLDLAVRRTARRAKKVAIRSKELVVKAKRVKREVNKKLPSVKGTSEERILKILDGASAMRSVDIAKELGLLHPSTRRSLARLSEKRPGVERVAEGWEYRE